MSVDRPVKSLGSERQIGWFCAYTPVEVLLASGLEPVRLFGSEKPPEASDTILHPTICPYVRSCLEQGLDGLAPAALVFAGCCDSMRRLYDAWSYYCEPRFTFLLDLPRGRGSRAVEMFSRSIEDMAEKIEVYTGVEITLETLLEAILARKEVDCILGRLSDECASHGIRTVHRVFMDAQILSPAEFLDEYTGRLTGDDARGLDETRKTVVVTGNILSSTVLLELIEDCGGKVGALDLCSVGRFPTWETGDDPETLAGSSRSEIIDYLARKYVSRAPCPRMLTHDERLDNLVDLARESGAKGVVFVPLMFCDPFLYELPRLKSRLEAAGLPGLFLESDFRDENIGQLRTRVEAFMEML